MMNPLNPLIAAGFDEIIGLIITVAIIGFSVLSQVMGGGKAKEQQQQQARRQQQQRAQQRANNPQAKSIESEIEDFLRQARGGAPKQAIPVAQPVADEPVAVRKLVDEPIEVRPMEVEPIEPGAKFTRELASHVESHIGQNSISQRDAHLGDVVEASDERIERHLKDTFSYPVGHLAHQDQTGRTSEIAEGTDANPWEIRQESATMASEIIELMKSPDSVRKMFIAMEVFKRPEI